MTLLTNLSLLDFRVCPHKRLDEKVMQLHLHKTAHAILKTYLCYVTHHEHCMVCFL